MTPISFGTSEQHAKCLCTMGAWRCLFRGQNRDAWVLHRLRTRRQHFERDTSFKSRRWCSDALVDSPAEGEMRGHTTLIEDELEAIGGRALSLDWRRGHEVETSSSANSRPRVTSVFNVTKQHSASQYQLDEQLVTHVRP